MGLQAAAVLLGHGAANGQAQAAAAGGAAARGLTPVKALEQTRQGLGRHAGCAVFKLGLPAACGAAQADVQAAGRVGLA